MIAMELSGVHVGRKLAVTYRFPSWPKSRQDAKKIIPAKQFAGVEHRATGRVSINNQYGDNILTVPFDATVEFEDDK